MALTYRPALPEDAAECVVMRGKTRQNPASEEFLRSLGITRESWADNIRSGAVLGHVCLQGERIVGYCFGSCDSGEIQVLAVLPDHESRGIGRKVLELTTAELASLGHHRLFLGCSPDPSSRSHGFYRRLGWHYTGALDHHGDEILELFISTEESPRVRLATVEDAASLAAIAESTFRATFASANSKKAMNQHCERSFGEAVQRREILDPAMQTFLCEHQHQLIGFSQLCPGARPVCLDSATLPGEIRRLYVLADFHGRGAAQVLMGAALARLRRHGCDVAWLGVWEHNPRAIAFYKKLEFFEAGEQAFRFGSELQQDIIMVRPLDAQSIAGFTTEKDNSNEDESP